jgi:AcrR family transcriptional regulator
VPPDASKTKATLLDSAARAFARDGVFNASLIDITRQAGQRNRAALSYHFGSRDGILCAVLDRHAPFLARREGELLDIAMPITSPTSPNTGRNFWRHPSSGPRPFGWPIPSTSSSTSNTPSSSAIRLARSRPFMPPVIPKLDGRAGNAIAAFIAANPKGRFGTHGYRLDEFGLRADDIRDRFADYIARYDVPAELSKA